MLRTAFPTDRLNRKFIGPEVRSSKPVKSLPVSNLTATSCDFSWISLWSRQPAVPHRCGDVAHPAESAHPLKSLAVGGVAGFGDDPLQFLIEELVVLGGIEPEISLSKVGQPLPPSPLPLRCLYALEIDSRIAHTRRISASDGS